MKKILLVIIFLIFPVSVLAKGEITNHYIDATVLNNGDLKVKELIVVEGKYDTFEYFINDYNNHTNKFNNSVDSYISSDIYNSDNVILNEIKIIEIDKNYSFNYIYHGGLKLNPVIDEIKDNFLSKFKTLINNDGIKITIYNADKKDVNGYYYEYTVKNIAVLHNDVAELNLDVIKPNHQKINNLEMVINLPGNMEMLKKWIHGPTSGHIVLTDDEEVRIFVDEIGRKQEMTVRLVFDKEVIKGATKTSNKDALNKIIDAESLLEDEERDAIRINNLISQSLKLFFETLSVLWLIGMIYSFLKVYFKNDREYESKFKGEYYDKIPDNYSPMMVGYLLNMDVSEDDFAASFLYLIDIGVINVKKVDKDYILTLKRNADIKENERKIIELIFGEEKDVVLSNIKIKASTDHTKFLQKYNNWYVYAILEAEKEKLFESTNTIKVKKILYSFTGLMLSLVSLFFSVSTFIFYTIFITSLIGLIYFRTFRKRTIKGNNKYAKWVAYKHYLEDYKDSNTREEYFVYATVFGCNKDLCETVKKTANSKLLDKLSMYNDIVDEIKKAIKNAYSNKA